MSPLEYLAEAAADWPGYALLVTLFLIAHAPLVKRWAVGIYDPLFLLLIANAFSWSVVWFMFLRGDIALRYVVSFTVAQLALYAGMWLGRPRSEAPPPAPAGRPDCAVALLTLMMAAIVHVGSTLAIWRIAGIPLFRESRLGAFEGSGGFGIFERLAESSALVAIFAVVYLLLHRKRLRRNLLVHAFLLWFVGAIALSGSKAAFLSVGQYVLSILFVYTALRHATGRFWGGRAGKFLLVGGTLFAIAVLAIQTEGDLVSAGLGFAYRVASFGDIYVFAYPNATIESVKGSSPLVGMFGAFLSTFRLFPQESVYPNIGYQFTGIVFPDLELIVGPNPQHPVFGYHYFGPFAFVFSFALGIFTSRLQARLYNRAHSTFFSGLIAFLMYFSLVNISVDFEYSLSKLASLIIGVVIVVGPVLLVLPRAPLWRLPRARRGRAANGSLATP
jgi:hypothetical protein